MPTSMHLRTNTKARRSLGLLLALAGSALTLPGLAGCDRKSDAARAIEAGATDLETLTGGGSAPALKGETLTTLKRAATTLTEAGKSDTPAEKGAAQSLLSTTMSGQADFAVSAAVEQEAQLLRMVASVRNIATAWSGKTARAAAAEAFDPSAQIAAIERSLGEKQTEITAATKRRDELSAALTALQARAKSRLDAGQAKIEESASIAQSAEKLTAREAVPVIERAAAVRREGDTLNAEGAMLQAKADLDRPEVEEAELIVAQLNNQKTKFEGIISELRARQAKAREDARAVRDGAAKDAADLDAAVSEAVALFEGGLTASYEDAIRGFGQAATAAKQGVAGAPSASRVASAAAKQSEGDVHLARATIAASVAKLLEDLSKANPAPPKAGDYASKARSIREVQKTSLEKAVESYESARSDYTASAGGLSGPAGGQVRERLEALGQALERLKSAAQGVSMDMPKAAEGSAPVDPALADTISRFFSAVKEDREQDVMALLHAPDASFQSLFTSMAKLNAAFKEKYGKTFSEAASTNPMLGQMAGPLALKDTLGQVGPGDLVITMEGEDKATATGPGLASPLAFSRVNGEWKFTMPGTERLGPMAALLAPIANAMSAVADEVAAGQHADDQAAVSALMTKMQSLLGGMMGGSQPNP